MTEPLPTFRYHPDPIATGSIEPSTLSCVACKRARGHIYVGPVYGLLELREQLCPWCIADGSAHERFGCEFADRGGGIGGYGSWERPSTEILKEVALRTPGFSTWQGEQWYTHCGDAAALIAIVGWAELQSYGQEAIDAIAAETGYAGEDLTSYLQALDRDHGPTAYLFRCLHCDRYGGYSDSL